MAAGAFWSIGHRLVAWRMTRRAPPAEEQRSEFDLTSTAPTMVALEAEPPPAR